MRIKFIDNKTNEINEQMNNEIDKDESILLLKKTKKSVPDSIISLSTSWNYLLSQKFVLKLQNYSLLFANQSKKHHKQKIKWIKVINEFESSEENKIWFLVPRLNNVITSYSEAVMRCNIGFVSQMNFSREQQHSQSNTSTRNELQWDKIWKVRQEFFLLKLKWFMKISPTLKKRKKKRNVKKQCNYFKLLNFEKKIESRWDNL